MILGWVDVAFSFFSSSLYGMVLNTVFAFVNVCGFVGFRIDRGSLKAGDHIYSWRTAYVYAHHGASSLLYYSFSSIRFYWCLIK